MKKTIIVLGCVCLMSLTSCFKKERVCSCTTTTTESNGTASTSSTSEPVVTTYKKIRKGKAKDLCVSYTYEINRSSGSITSIMKYDVKCSLD
jgi:hypothetical protein